MTIEKINPLEYIMPRDPVPQRILNASRWFVVEVLELDFGDYVGRPSQHALVRVQLLSYLFSNGWYVDAVQGGGEGGTWKSVSETETTTTPNVTTTTTPNVTTTTTPNVTTTTTPNVTTQTSQSSQTVTTPSVTTTTTPNVTTTTTPNVTTTTRPNVTTTTKPNVKTTQRGKSSGKSSSFSDSQSNSHSAAMGGDITSATSTGSAKTQSKGEAESTAEESSEQTGTTTSTQSGTTTSTQSGTTTSTQSGSTTSTQSGNTTSNQNGSTTSTQSGMTTSTQSGTTTSTQSGTTTSTQSGTTTSLQSGGNEGPYWYAYVRIRLKRRKLQAELVMKDMVEDLTKAYNEGRKINDDRYDELVNLYALMLGRTEDEGNGFILATEDFKPLTDYVLGTMKRTVDDFHAVVDNLPDDVFKNRVREINLKFDNQLSKARVEMITAGLFNSTVWTTTASGIERNREMALNDLIESKIDVYVKVASASGDLGQKFTDAAARLQQMAKDRLLDPAKLRNEVFKWMLEFMERRKDAFPGLDQIAGAAKQLGYAETTTSNGVK